MENRHERLGFEPGDSWQSNSVRSATAAQPNLWLNRPKQNSRAKIRLIAFPYAGAGASAFHSWAGFLPDTMELCNVQLPGRENRFAEPAFTRIQPIVMAAAEALLPIMDRPFAFYGHSLGALISYELTKFVGKMYGLIPLHLFVSGHDAPHLIRNRPYIHTLPEVAFIDELKRINGTSSEVFAHQDLLKLLIPILRADFEAAETYTYCSSAPVRCPISAMGGLEDDYVSTARLKAWQDHSDCGFSLHMFPGGHFYLNTNRSSLLEVIVRTLQRYVAVYRH